MDHSQKYLMLKAVAQPIALSVDDRFIEALDFVFTKWPFEILDHSENTSFLSVEFRNDQYQLSSEHMDKPLFWDDPLNAICEMVVEIAWARLRQDPSVLCLHGAAVDFGGRLAVFPATRRAGKSTLSVALAAAGHKVFTDDFLPIMLSGDQQLLGLSNGISPRLRLPVPQTFGDRANAYVANRSFIANRQYRYVTPRKTELAEFGECAPLGALVYLQREDFVEASIEPVSKAEALRDLIVQNFSRAINADGILKLLNFAASELPIYRLKYHDIDQAITTLQQEFSTWTNAIPRVSKQMGNEMFGLVSEHPAVTQTHDVTLGRYVQKSGIFVAEAGGQKFLAGKNGKSIHQLNNLAAAIWNLLSEPVNLDEAIAIVSSAFPDQTEDQITQDVTQVFKGFAACGLLEIMQNKHMPGQLSEAERVNA